MKGVPSNSSRDQIFLQCEISAVNDTKASISFYNEHNSCRTSVKMINQNFLIVLGMISSHERRQKSTVNCQPASLPEPFLSDTTRYSSLCNDTGQCCQQGTCKNISKRKQSAMIAYQRLKPIFSDKKLPVSYKARIFTALRPHQINYLI